MKGKPTAGWRRDLGAIVCILAFYGVLFLLGITCPIKFVTGVSCPGCGMTRAWLSLLRLDVGAAFSYHPLFLLGPMLAAGFLLRDRLSPTLVRVGTWVLTSAFLIVYLVRLVSGCNPEVVAWSPERGLLWRAAQGVLGWLGRMG